MRGGIVRVEVSVSVDSVFRDTNLQGFALRNMLSTDTETSSAHVYASKSLHAFSN